MIQLNPTIPVETPKGTGQAIVLIDYGCEHDLYWVVFIDDTRECWTFSNREIHAQPNITMGRMPDKKLKPVKDLSQGLS